MTSEELKKTYAALTTKALLDIVDHKFDYTDLAVSVALDELSTRQVSEQEITEYKKEQAEETAKFIRQNISDDLKLLQKILFYLFWIPFINFAFKQRFRYDGYVLKVKQANYYSIIGFVFFMLVAVLSVALDLTEWFFIPIWLLGFIPAYFFDERFNRQNQILKLKALIEDNEIAAQ